MICKANGVPDGNCVRRRGRNSRANQDVCDSDLLGDQNKWRNRLRIDQTYTEEVQHIHREADVISPEDGRSSDHVELSKSAPPVNEGSS